MSRPLSSSALPSTPLRRLSRGSYAASALARSTLEDPSGLDNLTPLLAELADTLEDTQADLEALDALNSTLIGFNESFATFLLGLKLGAYTTEWPEQPHVANYALAVRRSQMAAQAAQRAAEALEPRAEPVQQTRDDDVPEASFRSTADQQRGKPATRAVRGRGRGVSSAQQRQRKQDQLLAFAADLIQTLPITYREQQPHRREMEQVISILRQHPNGMIVADIVKASSPPVPSHRVNQACLALVQAKHALKVAHKGIPLYQLDPSRYPTAS